MKKTLLALLAGTAIAFSPVGLAQTPTAAAPIIPVADFFKTSDYAAPMLSPDGKQIAVLINVLDRNNIMVMDTDNPQKFRVLTGFKKDNVGGMFWASNNRIVFTVDSSNGREAASIFSVRTDKKKIKIVKLTGTDFSSRGAVFAQIVSTLEDDPEHMIVSYNKRYIDAPDLYKIAFDSKWRDKRKSNSSMELIGKNPGNVQNWIVDNNGDVRGAITLDGLESKWLYKEADAEEFTTLRTRSVLDEQINPIVFEKDNKSMIVQSNIGRDRNAIYKFNPITNKLGELIYGHDEVDVNSPILSRVDKRILGAAFVKDKLNIVYFDQNEKNIQAKLQKLFKGKAVETVSKSKDETIRIVRAYASNDPGTYYLYNLAKNKINVLAKPRGWLNPAHLAPMTAFEFTSRDGMQMHGYLTLPVGSDGKNLPLIINPHGGPYGPRDMITYRSDVQFLANRGYAVAQVNFRGSGGYGRNFEQAGYGGKWGAEMQHDVTDSVKHLIKEGIADPDRVCIYGGSYGGYATMAGLAFTPELYKCGVNVVGVTDIEILFDTYPKHWENARVLQEHQIGSPKDKALMKRMSPLAHAENIKAPVFIIHGKRDVRVHYTHATELRDRLDSLNKPYEWLMKAKEGHGFRKSENVIEQFTKMEAFFKKYL